jgi:hypothetical protein
VDIYHNFPFISKHIYERCQVVDSGAMSGPNLAASQQMRLDLLGPPCPLVSKLSRVFIGIMTSRVAIDVVKQTTTCPAGFSAEPDFG